MPYTHGRYYRYKSKGFTLIELLIVIAILGILAAAVLVAINPGQKIAASKNARVKSDLASIGRSAQLFNTETALIDCTGGASYPGIVRPLPVCGLVFNPSLITPDSGTYAISKSPANCMPKTADPCTGFAVSGPAYTDGTITADDTSDANGKLWCWKASRGSVEQVSTTTGCTAP